MSWRKSAWEMCALVSTLVAAGCQQWVSPYSADLQKRATDMLAEVSAWESTMLTAAGTAAADPRNPAVSGQLSKWQGEIEAMAAIEAGIDPGAGQCDKVVQSVLGGVASDLENLAPTAPAVQGSKAPAKLALHCESLPDIFEKMMVEVSSRIPENLVQQCKVSWIPDSYFAGKSTISGANAPKPSGSADAQSTALAEARLRCASLFLAPLPSVAKHGNLLSPLITDLDSVIYREGRQAPTK